MSVDEVQQAYDDFDEMWVPRTLYEQRTKEVESLQTQVTQLQSELTLLERRVKMWEVHG